MKIRFGPDGPMKFCALCRELARGYDDINRIFGRDRTRKDGYKLYCRSCRAKRRKEKLACQDQQDLAQ